MAQALCQMTFSYRDGVAGWTESWYGPSTLTQSLALALAGAYLRARMPLMGIGISSNFVRYRALDGTGLSYKFRLLRYVTQSGALPVDTNGGTIPGAIAVVPIYGGYPDRPYSCLMLTFAVPGTGRKVIFLSGLPDNVITDPVGPIFPPGYENQLNNLVSVLNDFNLGWNTRRGPGSFPKFPILSVNATAGTVTTIAAAFTAGTLVQVAGFRGLKGYRGQFTVLSTNSGVVTLSGYTPPSSLGKLPKSYIQAVGVNYQAAPNTISDYLETEHRRGKGLGVPVGRRPARHN